MKLPLIFLSFLLVVFLSGCVPEETYLSKGKSYLAQRQFDEAIASLSEAKKKIPQKEDEISPLLAKAHLGKSKQLNREEQHQKAMQEYQSAIEEDNQIASFSYQVELLYGLTEEEITSRKDLEVLRLQKMVFLNLNSTEYRKELAELALTKDGIIVFGVGKAPEGVFSEAQVKLLALRAAKMDAQRWLAYHVIWQEHGFDVDVSKISIKVPGGNVLQELELGFGAYLIKMELSGKLHIRLKT